LPETIHYGFSHDNGVTAVKNDGDIVQYQSDPTNPNSLLTSETGKLAITKKGIVWAASKYGGVTVIDPSENSYTRYENTDLSESSIIPEKVNTIYEDDNETIWVSSVKGVSKFKNGNFKSFYYNPSLKNDHLADINTFLYDSNGFLWVGTNNNGLYRLDYENLSIIDHYTLDQNNEYSFSSSTVLTIFKTSNEKIWIGTGGEGLFLYDKKINGFNRYSIDEGLPSNTIVSIIEDKQKTLWMGTRNGVARLNPGTDRFQNYSISDGLKDRIFFNQSIGIDNYGKLT
jgi:Two component regulator propeller.